MVELGVKSYLFVFLKRGGEQERSIVPCRSGFYRLNVRHPATSALFRRPRSHQFRKRSCLFLDGNIFSQCVYSLYVKGTF